VRPLLEVLDADAGMVDMFEDLQEGAFPQGMEAEDPEEIAKAFYTMLDSAQKPLHEKTRVSQLDGISRLIALKSQLGISRDGFDLVLSVFGGLLPEDLVLSACAVILQVLITSLVLCAGSVAGSNTTPGASPPPVLSPQHLTYPTQPYTWAPPSQTYSSWPGVQTQRGPRPPYWHYDSSQGSGWTQAQPQPKPQSGWCALEQGGGAGTSGDGAGTPGDGATS
jgi:hypothetical protein